MKRCSHSIRTAAGVAAMILVAVGGYADDYQSHYLYLGDDPDGLSSDWAVEAQGLTHDDSNWYFSQSFHLWRVPVGYNLNSFDENSPFVLHRAMSSYPALFNAGYDRFGDICVYRYNGTDYLLAPIEGGPAGLAVFRADTLAYIDHDRYVTQTASPWCAVDEFGALYSSQFDPVDHLLVYSVDWALLDQSGVLSFQQVDSIELLDESGSNPLTLHELQGGEFTPDGDLLYLGTDDGIRVFKNSRSFSGWRLVQYSTGCCGYFRYPLVGAGQGITIWDLEGISPHTGELHAMMRSEFLGFPDEVTISHYTRTIRVNAAHTGAQDGTPARPFRTVAGAANLAWDGAEIRIRANVYDEALTINKRVRLTSEGGTTRIGG